MLALTNKRSRLLVGPDLVLPKIHRDLTKQFKVIYTSLPLTVNFHSVLADTVETSS